MLILLKKKKRNDLIGDKMKNTDHTLLLPFYFFFSFLTKYLFPVVAQEVMRIKKRGNRFEKDQHPRRSTVLR